MALQAPIKKSPEGQAHYIEKLLRAVKWREDTGQQMARKGPLSVAARRAAPFHSINSAFHCENGPLFVLALILSSSAPRRRMPNEAKRHKLDWIRSLAFAPPAFSCAAT